MSESVVAVDAMGGDHAPAAVVAGAVQAARRRGLKIILTGPEGTPVTPKSGLPTVTDNGGKPQITIPASKPPSELQDIEERMRSRRGSITFW